MDAGEINAAVGGFFFGQMFAGQTQKKPALLNFVALRVNRDVDINNIIMEVLKDTFLELKPDKDLEIEFANNGQLKVLEKPKSAGWIKTPVVFPIVLTGLD